MNSIIVMLYEFKTANVELQSETKIFWRMQAISLLKKIKAPRL